MKKSEINAALAALKEIKMPKIEDKDLRNDLIENHFTLLDAGRKVDAAVADKRTVYTEAFKEDEQKIEELQQKLNETDDREEQRALIKQINSFDARNKAVKQFNEEAAKLYAEEVTGLKPINREKFMEEIKKMDNMKLSWVEALYPLFVLENKEPEAATKKKK